MQLIPSGVLSVKCGHGGSVATGLHLSSSCYYIVITAMVF